MQAIFAPFSFLQSVADNKPGLSLIIFILLPYAGLIIDGLNTIIVIEQNQMSILWMECIWWWR
jgi:hypothetical protein